MVKDQGAVQCITRVQVCRPPPPPPVHFASSVIPQSWHLSQMVVRSGAPRSFRWDAYELPTCIVLTHSVGRGACLAVWSALLVCCAHSRILISRGDHTRFRSISDYIS